MAAKNKPVNILNDILNDSQTGAIRGLDELNDLIHQPIGAGGGGKKKKVKGGSRRKRAKVVSVTAQSPTATSQEKGEDSKKKTTHYLSQKVFDDLGEAKQMISDYLPTGKKLKASKSKIVDTAVKILLEEFETKGKDSTLVKRILNKSKKE